MRVFDSLGSIPEHEFSRGTAVAIGKFDGVHRGHQALLHRVFEVAEARDLDPAVFTFANNPLCFLRPDLCPLPLMSREQRLEALAAEGVDSCVMVPFDAELAAVPAEQFVEQVLVGQLRVRHICVGADFRFGHRGMGDTALLVQMGKKLGFSVEIIRDVADQELGKVSSSNVRAALTQGDVDSAGRMLGRPATWSFAEMLVGESSGFRPLTSVVRSRVLFRLMECTRGGRSLTVPRMWRQFRSART
jgi:riboflavin kinase/FMN adenylyltransferase